MLVYILFLFGFIILIKGADILVDGASSIAKRYHVSDLVIGLTIVAFGTSTPELFVNLVASLNGNNDIAVGNVIGSNISNTFLILGVSALICPLTVSKGTVWKEIPFSLLAVIVLGILANDQFFDNASQSILTRSDGYLLLCFFCIFLYYSFSIASDINGLSDHVKMKQPSILKASFSVLLGLIGLSLGGKFIVNGAVAIAAKFGMSESMIGLTIVALGTSLPELATSAMAAYKKKIDIAVGNIVGSNIFNIFLVLGISSAIKPLPFQVQNNFDIGVVILSGILLFLAMFTFKKHALDRLEGGLFLLLYIGYIVYHVIENYS